MPRQSLSEFLYDYNLELLGEPMLAEEALINLVANARLYEGTSARTRMFCRFLSMSPMEKPLPVEALSVFLLALVRIQNGEIPLLPDYDSVSVSADKAIKTIEYVFAQAPYVVRSKIVLEAEKRCANRAIDLDSLLFFIVDQYVHEASRGEERLRALFVASDSDGDGNLTLQEFSDMVKHVNSKKSHRLRGPYSMPFPFQSVWKQAFYPLQSVWKFIQSVWKYARRCSSPSLPPSLCSSLSFSILPFALPFSSLFRAARRRDTDACIFAPNAENSSACTAK